ncbi:hypothetical protein PUN28_020888 [Cardiocondyla obscurior]|uniref:Secreted protein n=1 Tax=Cardiocondyla obscurior TaxID=286306 RepID=A0AAW2E7J2_9HYME
MHLFLVAQNATFVCIFLIAAQCYVVKFQNIFFCFLAISRLLMKMKARNRPVCIFLIAAQCYVVKFQKYFFVFGHISAAVKIKGSNRLVCIFLNAAQCYV